MKKISKIVWFGLLLNAALVTFLWLLSSFVGSGLNYGDYDLTYSEIKSLNIMSYMALPFTIAFLIQLISLPILFKLPKLGLVLAFVGGLVMIPLGLVFLVGFMLSYEKCINNNLVIFSKDIANDVSLAFHYKVASLAIQSIVFIILGVFVCSLGVQTGWLVIGAGLASLFLSFRLKGRIVIGLSQDQLIVTPANYAETYLVPLADVTLIEENEKLFKLHIKSSGVDRKCTLRYASIIEQDYQEGVKKILAKLNKTSVLVDY
ncbi:hypothetical protein [Serratia sp. DD3]|uniref:hypothetical protein n=1 Tax=Serratia sp. DD3 TaxID=1410619 RepID=UPI0004D51E75|nr:hypothetical protein [Serratia sp. DD3]KEY57165.1 hypothetical protein SRDD_39340 [Serratia sp. DD3]